MKFNHDTVKIEDNIKTEEINGKRFYVAPDGNKYPSVTTITGWKKRAFFAEWRRKNPDESRRVLSRGTSFHTIIEKYLLNEDAIVEEKKSSRPGDYYMFAQIKEELDKINNIKALETALWSGTLKMAGRVDCIAEYDGKLSVIDFKTSKAIKDEKDIQEYFMQATAYAIMFKERTGITIKNIAILMSCEDGSVMVYQKNPVEYVAPLKNAIDQYYEENVNELSVSS
jgi:genome maintenance exonuclease 1